MLTVEVLCLPEVEELEYRNVSHDPTHYHMNSFNIRELEIQMFKHINYYNAHMLKSPLQNARCYITLPALAFVNSTIRF